MTRGAMHSLRAPMLIVSAVALAWAAGLLWQAWPELVVNFARVGKFWLAFTIVGIAISTYVGFELFRMLFTRVQPNVFGRLSLAHLYFTAQLMKHMPGRVWGVAYQSVIGGATPAEWVSVNGIYMLLSGMFAVWTAVVLLAFAYAPSAAIVAFAVGVSVYTFGWSPRLIASFVRAVNRFPHSTAKKIGIALRQFSAVSLHFKARVFAFLAIIWGVYFASWACYGWAWPGLGPHEAVALSAIYMVAWLVGYLSFVTPSGLGVRELAFALLARDFPADAVISVAIFGRVTLLLVDIAFAVVFAPFSPRRIVATTDKTETDSAVER